MKRKMIGVFIATLLFLLGVTSMSYSKPIWLEKRAKVSAKPETHNGRQVVTFTWRYGCDKDMIYNYQVHFCPDPLRDGCDDNIPISIEKCGDGTVKVHVPMEIISGGQSAFNLANDNSWLNTLWLGLPDCNLELEGDNLIFYKSIADPDIPRSGGMHILYVGPGAPFIPQAGDSRLYTCGVNAPVISAVVEAPIKKSSVAAKKYRTRADGSICEEPCIDEIVQNTRSIKADTTEIKESVGKADETDAADEKTLHQKARKTLKIVKKVDKSVGTSKSGRSLHDKIGEFRKPGGTTAGILEEIHKDVKDIKGSMKIPENQQPCNGCHVPQK
jgi:hypothetical protein